MATDHVLSVKNLRGTEPATVPKVQYEGDAGMDLTISRYAYVAPGAMAHLSTNVAIAVPPGTYGLVVPRSSALSSKRLHVSIGLIDPGYRGEVMILVHNPTGRGVTVNPGERIAQLLLVQHMPATVRVVDTLPSGSKRGSLGFGSTGGYAEE